MPPISFRLDLTQVMALNLVNLLNSGEHWNYNVATTVKNIKKKKITFRKVIAMEHYRPDLDFDHVVRQSYLLSVATVRLN